MLCRNDSSFLVHVPCLKQHSKGSPLKHQRHSAGLSDSLDDRAPNTAPHLCTYIYEYKASHLPREKQKIKKIKGTHLQYENKVDVVSFLALELRDTVMKHLFGRCLSDLFDKTLGWGFLWQLCISLDFPATFDPTCLTAKTKTRNSLFFEKTPALTHLHPHYLCLDWCVCGAFVLNFMCRTMWASFSTLRCKTAVYVLEHFKHWVSSWGEVKKNYLAPKGSKYLRALCILLW